MTAFTCVPLAIVCPCARCVEAITSSGSSAAQTPDATASWPIATCRKPGSSPARKRSSTFSSKRRMSSISRKSSCRRSSESASAPLAMSSTFAIAPHYADPRMGLVEQWGRIRSELPEDWGEAKLNLSVKRDEQRSRAAALLSPAGPGRLGDDLRVSVHRAGGGIGPDQADKLFGKLDAEKIRGELALVTVGEREARPEAPREQLAEAWGRTLDTLPADWSDLLCELELASSDHLPRAALLAAPLNPTRVPGRSAVRFRAARTFGYGASPEMTQRCLERLDAERIPATLEVLHVLSDTHNVATQGPVWRVAGKAV